MKIIVVIFLLAIFYCLASGAFFLTKPNAAPAKLAKALTWRIILSMTLFLFLLLAYWAGWMSPHNIAVTYN